MIPKIQGGGGIPLERVQTGRIPSRCPIQFMVKSDGKIPGQSQLKKMEALAWALEGC
jgi:hypothetical protein